jgi:hypothetical protein
MQTWPLFLPHFSANNYSWSIDLPIIRSDLQGHVDQRLVSHRELITFPTTLILYGVQLPLFEFFIRELCNEGNAYFNGYYLTESGEQSGVMRLVNGAYNVITDGLVSTVTCSVELKQ